MGRVLLTTPFRTKRKDLKFTFLGQEWEVIYGKRITSTVMGRENVAGQWICSWLKKNGLRGRRSGDAPHSCPGNQLQPGSPR